MIHFLGPPGTGKSHLATALGVEAVKAGRSVYFASLADIISALAKAHGRASARPTMRQTHMGGEKVFVDFAGDTIDIFDPITGEAVMARHLGIGSVETGVVAIGVGDGGLEIIADHKLRHAAQKPEQIGMHADPVGQALARAGLGVGVVRRPHIAATNSFMACATAILAARPRRPKDKAKVEVVVQIAQRWVLARLRNNRFFSLGELNAAIGMLVVELNARLFGRSAKFAAVRLSAASFSLFRRASRRKLFAPLILGQWPRVCITSGRLREGQSVGVVPCPKPSSHQAAR